MYKRFNLKIIGNPLIVSLLINLLFFGLYGFPVYTSPFDSAHFALPTALGTSDLTGAIRIAEIFTKIDFSSGWTNFINYPSGESIYTIQFLSQALPHLLLYVLSPLGPMFATFFLQFFFNTISTFGLIYLLKTYIKSNKAIFVVVTSFFMSNFLIGNLQAHLLGNLWGLPMLYIASLGRKMSNAKKYVIAGALIVISVFSDIYLAYSIIFITLAFALHKFLFDVQYVRAHNRSDLNKVIAIRSVLNRKKLLTSMFMFVSIPILLNSKVLKPLWKFIYSGNIFIEAAPLGFNPFHFGYLQIFLAVFGVLIILWRKQFDREDQFLFIGAIVIFLVTVNFRDSPIHMFSPVYNYRKLLPNFDHNQRLVPILVVLVYILMIRLAMKRYPSWSISTATKSLTFIYVLAITVVGIRLIQLMVSSHVSVHPERYEKFGKIIPVKQAYLSYPLNFEGRAWIQQGYINRATANSLIGSNDDIRQAFENSSSEVVSLFQRRNVNFLLVPCNLVSDLNKTWEARGNGFDSIFKWRNQVIDQGYEKGPTTICLYELITNS